LIGFIQKNNDNPLAFDLLLHNSYNTKSPNEYKYLFLLSRSPRDTFAPLSMTAHYVPFLFGFKIKKNYQIGSFFETQNFDYFLN